MIVAYKISFIWSYLILNLNNENQFQRSSTYNLLLRSFICILICAVVYRIFISFLIPTTHTILGIFLPLLNSSHKGAKTRLHSIVLPKCKDLQIYQTCKGVKKPIFRQTQGMFMVQTKIWLYDNHNILVTTSPQSLPESLQRLHF